MFGAKLLKLWAKDYAEATEARQDPIKPLSQWAQESVEIIPDAEQAKAKIEEIVSTELERSNRELTIDNFGLDFATIQATFDRAIKPLFRHRRVAYRGLIIEPDSPQIIAVTTSERSNISPARARGVVAYMNATAKQTMQDLIHTSIEIKSYSHAPMIHGFLIAGDHLILGFTHFRQRGLVGGDHPYIYVRKNDSSPFVSELFNAYATWFQYLWETGELKVSINVDGRSGAADTA